MADLTFQRVRHDHKAFLEKISKHRDFSETCEALDVEYALAHEMLAARSRAGLTQEAVADRMGTTKSATSRLEVAGKHAPSVASLKRYAAAVGCTLKIGKIGTDTIIVTIRGVRSHDRACHELPEPLHPATHIM